MSKSLPVCVACLLVGSLATGRAMGEDRPASKIVADVNAVAMPRPPEDRDDAEAVREFLVKRRKAVEERSALIGELYRSHPDSPELAGLILQRWQAATIPGPRRKEARGEIDEVLAGSRNESLVAQAAFMKAMVAIKEAGSAATGEELLKIADAFTQRAPKDPRGATFLSTAGAKMIDPARSDAINRRIAEDYPDSPIARQKFAENRIREAVGRPFEFEFVDAIKGGEVSSAKLKGKVVIVDFWATWCGPCVAEIPKMKELYAEYKDKGVEFIGVSLDRPRSQGGYDSLKRFVEKNQVDWPQYYEGKASAGDFAEAWGIQAIPTVFAVGADGKLASIEARGQLEELIPKLLDEARKDESNP